MMVFPIFRKGEDVPTGGPLMFKSMRPALLPALALLTLLVMAALLMLCRPVAADEGPGTMDYWNNAWKETEFFDMNANADILADPATGHLYLYGGSKAGFSTAAGIMDDLWRYDPAIGEWTIMPGGDEGPGNRAWNRMAIDVEGRRLFVYGGYNTVQNYYLDLWEYNLTTSQWTNISVDSETGIEAMGYHDDKLYGITSMNSYTPPDLVVIDLGTRTVQVSEPGGGEFDPRNPAEYAFDHVHARFYMVGGSTGYTMNQEFFNDTWVLHCQNATWERMADNPHTGRYGHGLAYSPTTDGLYLYGGVDYFDRWPMPVLDDLWYYSVTDDTWTELESHALPGELEEFQLEFDPVNDGLYLYNSHPNAWNPETRVFWTRDMGTGSWSRYEPQFWAPSTLFSTTWAVDGKLLVFGGINRSLSYSTLFEDMLEYDFETDTWRVLDLDPMPPPRWKQMSCVDRENRRLFIYGGMDNDQEFYDLWSFDADTYTWTKHPSGGTVPNTIWSAMAYSNADGCVYLFGGYQTATSSYSRTLYRYETYTSRWRVVTTDEGPSFRGNATMVYNSHNETMYVMGGLYGNIFPEDLWAFHVREARWYQVVPTGVRPEGRFLHSAFYDPIADGMVVFGGYEVPQYTQEETWIYDFEDNRWSPVYWENSPPARYTQVISFDYWASRYVVFGGNHWDREVWSLSVSIWQRILIRPGQPEYVVVEDTAFKQRLYTIGSPLSTWDIETNATWLELDKATGILTGTPDNSHVGWYTAKVNVTSTDGHEGVLWLRITVTNVPPEMTSDPPTEAREGEPFAYDLNCTDEGQGNVTWSLDSPGGEWLSIDPATGVLSGTPGSDDVGQFFTRVRVDDGNGGTDVLMFTLRVIDVNDAPVILTVDVLEATEDVEYAVDYQASDDEPARLLIWSLVTDAAFLSIDRETGMLRGTPRNSHVGSHSVTVRVIDLQGALDERTFLLEVVNVNDPPVIEMVGDHIVGGIIRLDLGEGEEASYTVMVTDVDSTSIGLTLGPAPDFAELADERVLVLKPLEGDMGEHSLTLIADDGAGGTHRVDLTIVVGDVNAPPRITSVIPPPFHVDEDEPFVLNIEAEDPDGDDLTWSDDTDLFDIGPDGVISCTPLQEDVGLNRVIITVTDEWDETDSIIIDIWVDNVNDAPVIVSLSPEDGSVHHEGVAIGFGVAATDEEGDALTYTWYHRDTVIGTGDQLSFADLPSGTQTVTVVVEDGNATTSADIRMLVEAAETGPDDDDDPGPGAGTYAAIVIAVVAVVLVAAFLVVRMRKQAQD